MYSGLGAVDNLLHHVKPLETEGDRDRGRGDRETETEGEIERRREMWVVWT